MSEHLTNIFERMRAGGIIANDDPGMIDVWRLVQRAIQLSAALNTSTTIDQIRERLSELIGSAVPESTTIFVPYYTNFGRHWKERLHQSRV